MNTVAHSKLIDVLQTRWLGGVGAVVLTSALLLTWLFVRAEAVAPQAHFEYSLLMRNLREADAKIDNEVLSSRMELNRNYDALTAQLRAALALGARIAVAPDFLPTEDRAKVRATAGDLDATLKQKARLIDGFQRGNAVLRNSLAFFPVAAEEFLRSGRSGQPRDESRDAAARYARLILGYARTPDPERREEIEELAHRLGALPLAAAERRALDILLRHGDIIARHVVEVDRVMREMLRLPTATQLEMLNLQYARGHEHAVGVAGRYRAQLYALALLLTAYLAYTFIRLDRARRSLADAHREVSERYALQLRAEEQLRLHATSYQNAHEGIALTDAAGTILDVNPAFTRITGYERSEAIGRNPRMLNSGRQDREFYEAMWKCIQETGSWRGEIFNRNKYGEVFPELLSIAAVRDAAGQTTHYVAVFADISRLKEQENQLTRLAYFDALTELPNRVLLEDRIAQGMNQTRRSGTLMAVCYLDLDGFKPVNDTWGHEAGDQLLVEMARRLRDGLRGGDTVARLGGDEFVLLLLDLETLEECEQALQRLLASINQPLLVTPRPVTLSASIGVTVFPQDDGDADTLLRHADQAMYQAKQSGKNRYQLFDPAQDRQARSRHDQVARIEEACDKGEFVLYYQPKVDMRRGRVVGAEALIRWQHPERGLLAPGEFLPLIEEHELIVRVGEWVIETALGQMEAWQAAGLELAVSVNVAGRHLQSPDFVRRLSDALVRYPAVARRLEMEVLETSALEDMAAVSRVIEECRTLGVSFALDDFGTGYSSLTYLKRLPAETIKIDQSFVREIVSDPSNLAIVQGIVGLATAFQRRAIAEGVETVEHGRLLLQQDCDIAQGYGIAKPMPASQVVAWCRDWRPDPEWAAIAQLRWVHADYPMLVAEIEHRNWVALLIQSIRDDQPALSPCVDDPRRSRFGEWYYGSEKRYRGTAAWRDIAVPLQEVHCVAADINRDWRAGRIDQARTRIPDLLARRDSMLAALRQLRLRVAVVREEGAIQS